MVAVCVLLCYYHRLTVRPAISKGGVPVTLLDVSVTLSLEHEEVSCHEIMSSYRVQATSPSSTPGTQ